MAPVPTASATTRVPFFLPELQQLVFANVEEYEQPASNKAVGGTDVNSDVETAMQQQQDATASEQEDNDTRRNGDGGVEDPSDASGSVQDGSEQLVQGEGAEDASLSSAADDTDSQAADTELEPSKEMKVEDEDEQLSTPTTTFARVELSNGAIYTGELEEGMFHGKGRMEWPSGAVYEGDFTDNTITGVGTYSWPDGSCYTGSVEHGLRHGHGEYSLAAKGVWYQGQWQLGKRNGQGCMHCADGSKYVGAFKDNMPHGTGLMLYRNGNVYDGQWVAGKRHGLGAMLWKDKTTYCRGQWENDQPNGHCECIYLIPPTTASPNVLHNRYIGQLVEGRRHGKGAFFYADGSVYNGDWNHDLKHGSGTFTSANGTTFSCSFNNDLLKDDLPERALQTFWLSAAVWPDQDDDETENIHDVLLRYLPRLRRLYHAYAALPVAADGFRASHSHSTPNRLEVRPVTEFGDDVEQWMTKAKEELLKHSAFDQHTMCRWQLHRLLFDMGIRGSPLTLADVDSLFGKHDPLFSTPRRMCDRFLLRHVVDCLIMTCSALLTATPGAEEEDMVLQRGCTAEQFDEFLATRLPESPQQSRLFSAEAQSLMDDERKLASVISSMLISTPKHSNPNHDAATSSPVTQTIGQSKSNAQDASVAEPPSRRDSLGEEDQQAAAVAKDSSSTASALGDRMSMEHGDDNQQSSGVAPTASPSAYEPELQEASEELIRPVFHDLCRPLPAVPARTVLQRLKSLELLPAGASPFCQVVSRLAISENGMFDAKLSSMDMLEALVQYGDELVLLAKQRCARSAAEMQAALAKASAASLATLSDSGTAGGDDGLQTIDENSIDELSKDPGKDARGKKLGMPKQAGRSRSPSITPKSAGKRTTSSASLRGRSPSPKSGRPRDGASPTPDRLNHAHDGGDAAAEDHDRLSRPLVFKPTPLEHTDAVLQMLRRVLGDTDTCDPASSPSAELRAPTTPAASVRDVSDRHAEQAVINSTDAASDNRPDVDDSSQIDVQAACESDAELVRRSNGVTVARHILDLFAT